MDIFFGILLFNAASVVGVLQSILWAGLILMPFAAATCAVVARRKGGTVALVCLRNSEEEEK